MATLDTGVFLALIASGGLLAADLARDVVQIVSPPMISGEGYVTKNVHPGEDVIVHWEVTKLTKCRGKMWRRWEADDGFLMRESARPTRLKASPEIQRLNVPVQVPNHAPVGELKLYIDSEYDCGTGKTYSYEMGPVTMTVTE